MRAVHVRTVVCATHWRPATPAPVRKATQVATASSLATTVTLTPARMAAPANLSTPAVTSVTVLQVS